MHELQQVRARIALDVELDAGMRLQERRDLVNVSGGDVAGIRARMHGDAGAPASTQTPTASMTDGRRPPRELRTVAILLTLTESLTIEFRRLSSEFQLTPPLRRAP